MSRFLKSKMYKLISLLTDTEFEEFGVWLRSPVFKPSKKLIEIHQAINDYKKSKILSELTKKHLYEMLYPGKSFKASYFNNLIREFTAQTKAYLIWSSNYLQENKKLAYFSELRRRGEHDLFFKESADFLEKEAKEEYGFSFNSGFMFQLYEQIYYHSSNFSKYETDKETFKNLHGFLEVYFLEKKLALLHEQKTEANIKKETFDQSELIQLIPYLEKSDSPIITLYQKRINRVAPVSMDSFHFFYESYLRVFDQLPDFEKRIFLLVCINDAVLLTTKAIKGASLQLMNLYKFGIRENLLLTLEVVTPIMFNNIVSVAIQEDEIIYLQDLVWQYRSLLPAQWGKDAIVWAELNIAFAEGKFSYVNDVIMEHQCRHWLYKLQFNIIKMMALFELVIDGQYKMKSMDALAMAFKKYVERNDKKYQFRPQPYEAFIKYAHDLAKLKVAKKISTEKEKEAFYSKIMNVPHLYRRDWLIEKIEL